MNIDILLNSHALLVLLLGTAVGAVAGYLGSLMLTKRLALMGGALGHLTLPGVSLALVFGFDVSLGALLFLLAGIGIIWLLERRTGLSIEALTAVVFAVSVATSFLFLPKHEASTALIGDVSNVTWLISLASVALVAGIFMLIRSLFNGLVLLGISPDLAQAQGISPARYNGLFLISIAFIVALGVRIVGGLMTAALVSIPACTSRNLSKNLHQYSIMSLLFGAISCFLGIVIGLLFSLPVGPMIILVNGFFFLLSLIKA